jgi:hypothetical protein
MNNINFQNGACIDTRTDKQKEKDYNIKEVVASVDVVDWKEKSGTEWRSFPVQNQGSSGSCVMATIAKQGSVLLWLKEGVYIPFSRAFYQLRSNKPSAGMIGVEAFEIWRKNGLPLEQLVPSEKMSDAEMDAIKVEQYEKDIAEVFKISNHIGIDNGDFEKVASVIQKTGKAVMCWFYFTSAEWAREIPIIRGNIPFLSALKHSVAVVDYGLRNGKKYLKVEDSAHFAGLTEHYISEEFFRERNWFNRYPMTFQFQETLNPLIKKNLGKDLEFGMRDSDIIILQDFLKDLGYFATNIDSTGFYGAITVKAVIDFQFKNGIIKTENSPGAGRCGPATRAYINSNY